MTAAAVAPAEQMPYAAPGYDFRADAGAAGEPSRRKYPALLLAATLYQILATLVLVLGAIGVLVVLGVSLFAMARGFSAVALLITLGYVILMSVYVFLMWITLTAASEFIKLSLNLEHDSHRTADAIRNLTQIMSQK